MAEKTASIFDKYSNKAVVSMAEPTASGNLVASRIDFNVLTQKDRLGLVIEKIIYNFDITTIQDLVAGDDYVLSGVALSSSMSVNNLQDYSNPALIDQTFLASVGASTGVFKNPIIHDFSFLKGNGLLIPADVVYAYLYSNSLAASALVDIVLYYHWIRLAKDEAAEILGILFPANL
jgi:hypothetical protein